MSKAGSWVIREWMGGGYRYRTLGHADDIVRADGRDVLTFEQATRAALAPYAAAPIGRLTIKDALARYFVNFAARSKHARIPLPRSGFPSPVQGLPRARSAFCGRPTGDFPRVPRGRAVSAVDCIRGNTHCPFADINNVQIADLMAGFLARKGLD